MIGKKINNFSSFIFDCSLFLYRYFLAAAGLFVLGLLIGWFTHTPTVKPSVPPADTSDLLEELLRRITADKIDALQR